MVVTNDDVQRIRARVAAGTAGVPSARPTVDDDWLFLADDGYLQLKTRDGPPAKGSPGGKPCVFLGDDGRCTVWEARPEGCRLYPAIWGEFEERAILDEDYCPHTDGFALPRAMDDAARRLTDRLKRERQARI